MSQVTFFPLIIFECPNPHDVDDGVDGLTASFASKVKLIHRAAWFESAQFALVFLMVG